MTRAPDEREVDGAAGGRNLRWRADDHVPIFVGVFSLAAGTVAMAGAAAWIGSPGLPDVAGVALIPLGLTMLRVASAKRD